MGFTVADLTTLKKIVLDTLNASTAYSSTTDDDKFTDGAVAEYVFEGDERFFTAIAETREHWARPDIMDWSSDVTTYLAEVPAHLGDLGEVRIKYVSTDSVYQLAKPARREEIEIIRRNTDSTFTANHNAAGTLSAGYFDPDALRDGVCAFTGYAFQVRVIASYARTTALQSPSNYLSGILAHALSLGFSKDGLDPNLASYYSKEAMSRELQVRGNARSLPEMAQGQTA